MPIKTEILPIASVLTSVVPLCVNLVFVMILLFCSGNYPTWHVVMLVPGILCMYIFLIAIALYISALVVFVRDVQVILPNILMALMFATPIFYPVTAFPHFMVIVSNLNPFYIVAQCFRLPIMHHQIPSLWSYAYLLFLSFGLLLLALRGYRRSKVHFSAFV